MNQTDFIKYASDNRGIPPKLTRAVIKQLGGFVEASQDFRNIANHGISGGLNGVS